LESHTLSAIFLQDKDTLCFALFVLNNHRIHFQIIAKMKNQQRLADKKEEQTLERTSKEKKEIFY
jgi:hypothetical protein